MSHTYLMLSGGIPAPWVKRCLSRLAAVKGLTGIESASLMAYHGSSATMKAGAIVLIRSEVGPVS